jgi:cytochrome c oxidase subunit IV
MTGRQFRQVILTPAIVWLVIAAAITATSLYASLPNGPQKPAVSLAIAGAQAILSGVVFMRLDKAAALVRLAAMAGFLWLSLLFILSFGDYLTRPWPP